MSLTFDEDVIVAQCTAQGSGSLALIRLCGTESIILADQFCLLASGKALIDCPTHTVHFARIVDASGQTIDQVMVTIMRAPKTFTGQDTVEITSHNNQLLVQDILQRALACGARMARHGEFSQRAVQNGKMDLLQAEALNELISAQTHQVTRQALSQLEGSFSSWIASIEQELLRARAFCEASFEFIDEEMVFDSQIEETIRTVRTVIATIKRTFSMQQQIRQGIRIALIGSVNAGKSSLFNALIGTARAIVSPQAGTTRDTIEASICRQGAYWTLIDTAGLRETNDSIEREGIARSYVQAEASDIIILVVDGSRTLTAAEHTEYESLYVQHQNKTLLVYTKSDLPHKATILDTQAPIIALSSITGQSLDLLEEKLVDKAKQLLAQAAAPYLVNQRQYNLLLGLERQLDTIEHLLSGDKAYELLSYHLQDALAHMSEMTGKTVSEKTMDTIFRQFCIGK